MFEGNSFLGLVSRLRGAFYHRNDRTMTIYGLAASFASEGTDYTVLASDFAIGCFCNAASRTYTLPAIAASVGQIYAFVKTDATANTATIDANGSETINDETSIVLRAQWDSVILVGGASSWRIIARGSASGGSTPYVAKTANYTLGSTDGTVECTANSFTITLPSAVPATGRVYNIKNSGNGVITINTTSSQTIDGNASGVLKLVQYDNLTVQSNGANWIIL